MGLNLGKPNKAVATTEPIYWLTIVTKAPTQLSVDRSTNRNRPNTDVIESSIATIDTCIHLFSIDMLRLSAIFITKFILSLVYLAWSLT